MLQIDTENSASGINTIDGRFEPHEALIRNSVYKNCKLGYLPFYQNLAFK